jgi:tagaturonate reductase
MKTLNKEITKAIERPVRVLQYGEGNFLRGFVDEMIDIANEKGVFHGNIAIVKAIPYGSLDAFREQEGQYTLSLRGIENGQPKVVNRIITSIADAVGAYEDYEAYAAYGKLDSLRFIVSNTTEAGIVFDEADLFEAKPPKTFPGKLTKLLYERFVFFQGDREKGLIIIPCELIENNGGTLRQCVISYAKLWKLGEDFLGWLNEACVFCSTLVDRIVTGYPREEAESFWQEAGYVDKLLDTGELFALWVIESDKDISEELPLPQAGLPVIFTDNQKPYRERKVRILNGAHTSFVLASYLAGNDMVLNSMQDKLIREFMRRTVFDEIIPTLSLPKEELIAFANSVMERFENPYIKHALLSISLNSVSKWKARCLPSFKGYVKSFGKLPAHLTFSLAALMSFYRSSERTTEGLIAYRDGEAYTVMDDAAVLDFFAKASGLENLAFAKAFLSQESFFGEDLTHYEGLAEAVAGHLDAIAAIGMRKTIEGLLAGVDGRFSGQTAQ